MIVKPLHHGIQAMTTYAWQVGSCAAVTPMFVCLDLVFCLGCHVIVVDRIENKSEKRWRSVGEPSGSDARGPKSEEGGVYIHYFPVTKI
jgi:hypothetical protein